MSGTSDRSGEEPREEAGGVEINKVLYPLQRFKLMGYLCQVERSNYRSITEFTQMAAPEISRTVATLEQHGYVQVWKDRNGRYPETIVAATELGRREMKALVRALARYTGT